MFIRWKKQARAPQWELRPGAKWRTKTRPVTLFVAYLVQAVRVEGKPRQKQQYLASIRDDYIARASARLRFWRAVQKHFQGLNLSEEQQKVLKAKLLERVPDVTREQIEVDNRETSEAIARARASLGKA